MHVNISRKNSLFVIASEPIGLPKESVLSKDSHGFIATTRRESCGSGGFFAKAKLQSIM